MATSTVEINLTTTTLEIASDPPTVLEVSVNPQVEIVEVGIQGPRGTAGESIDGATLDGGNF